MFARNRLKTTTRLAGPAHRAALSPERLEPRTLFAAPNITSISTGGTSWNEGEYQFLSASFTDADANDRRTAVVDWGDGSADDVIAMAPGVRSFSTNRHTYPDDETSVLGQPRRYTITVTVTDSTNQTDTETRQIQVNNVPPVVRLPGEQLRVPEGVPVTLPAAFSDPGADTHTFNWRVTRGFFPDVSTVFESTARDLVFTPPDEGFYEVALEVRDDDGGARTGTAQLWAYNTPPVLTVSGATSTDEGAPYVLNLGAADAGADTITRWMIDWGDGSVEAVNGSPPTVTHAYDGPGNYTIRASATDEDGTFSAAPLDAAWRAGDADSSFGGPGAGGTVLTDFPLPVKTTGRDAVVYPDGSVLVLRNSNSFESVEGLVLARFKPDGTFDGAFDRDGRLFVPGRFNTGHTLALQPDGKILFAGVRAQANMESYVDVFRLNPDGSPDAAFGAAGVATARIGAQQERTTRTAHDLLLQPDGKIVVATGSNGIFVATMQAVRFNPDGSPDATFGAAGRVELTPPSPLAVAAAYEVLAAPGGRIALVGDGSDFSNSNRYGVVAMLKPDGTVDATYGNNGWAVRPLGNSSSSGYASAFQPDGKLVVAIGNYTAATAWNVYRYNADGTPDQAYGGGDGVADPAFLWGHVYSVAAAPGNKMLVAGTFNFSANSNGVAVARYNADGSLDATFSADGKITPIGDHDAGAVTVLAAPGDRVVVVNTYDTRLKASRLNNDGTYDATFGQAGNVVEHRLAPWQGVASGVRSLHVLPDKKILAVGNEPGGRNNLLFMARYLPDGTPDLSFGDFGRVALLAGQSSTLNGVHVDAAGKVLISRAGSVYRFNADGSPDAAFDNAYINFSPARHFAIAPDGKIVGTAVRPDDGALIVLRFNPDGTPDAAFGDAGRFEGFPGFASVYNYDEVKAVTVLPDGSVVVGGRGLVRLTPAGAPDPTFGGGDGLVPAAPMVILGYEPHRPNFGVVRGITLAPDGRIVTAWSGYGEAPGGFAVARHLADGTPDPTFGVNGQWLPGRNGIAERVALDPRGRILLGGFGSDSDAPAGGFVALRLLPDGTLDRSFGRDGGVAVPTSSGNVGDTFFNQMAVLDAGDVLLGGLAPDGRFLLSRFRADDERALTVAARNLAPTAGAGPDLTSLPGRLVHLTGTFSDPGPADALSFRWTVTGPGGATVAEGAGHTIAFVPPSVGRYTATFTVTDDDGAAASDTAVLDVAPRVVGRHVFYDNSAYDGRRPGPGAADDAAVAADKQPLTPGGSAAAAVTGYSRGINGVMFDVAGGLPMTALAGIAGSVGLRMGTGGDPAAWAEAPRPSQIDVRAGAGVDGSDRVTLTWPDGAIKNTWLQVTVQAPAQYGLPADVFVFGNLVGETAFASLPARVDGADFVATRAALGRRAAIADPRDHDRDGRISAADVYAVRANYGRRLTEITPAAAAPAVSSASPRRRPMTRDVLGVTEVGVPK